MAYFYLYTVTYSNMLNLGDLGSPPPPYMICIWEKSNCDTYIQHLYISDKYGSLYVKVDIHFQITTNYRVLEQLFVDGNPIFVLMPKQYLNILIAW